jgi:alpha-beta hydrolase superfamily lysophospholipase
MVAFRKHYGLLSSKTHIVTKKPAMIIAIVLAALLIVYLAISAYIAHSIMKVPRLPLGDTPASVGLDYKDVSFPSRVDRLTLKGWYIAGKKAFTVIIVTGMHQNRVDYSIGVLDITKDLVARGYNVLLFDLRGRGESEGNGVLLTHFKRDIGGAVDYIKQRGCPAEQAGFIGFSAGAASSVIFASDENVAALISDSCFADVADVFIGKGVSESGMPHWLIKLFGMGTLFMSTVMYGYRKVNPVDRVSAVACPILFIQGDKDDLVPVSDAHRLMEASGNPEDEVWVVPDAGHTLSYLTDPAGYMERVASFLAKAERAAARKQAARLF